MTKQTPGLHTVTSHTHFPQKERENKSDFNQSNRPGIFIWTSQQRSKVWHQDADPSRKHRHRRMEHFASFYNTRHLETGFMNECMAVPSPLCTIHRVL